MPSSRKNPFYAMLGIVGFLFAITATSYCISVLRGIRPESKSASPHALERLIDRYGTTALGVELALLAIGTFGAIAIDEIGGREVRRRIQEERQRHPAGAASGAAGDPGSDAGTRS